MYPYGAPQPGYPGYPPQEQYPQGGAPYPPQGGYPYPQQGYPPQGYPPQGAPYPPQSAPYPPQGYVQPQAPYPTPGQMPSPMNPGYPVVSQVQPQYQSAPSGYPAAGAGYAPNFPHQGYQQGQPGSSARRGTPTVPPVDNFDAASDAQILRKAMKGFGTDEDALISVICRRPDFQRQQIVQAFKQSYGKDLIENIKSETKGNFENLLVALLTPRTEFFAKELHDAMEGTGTDEEVLIEVLCCLSNQEIIEIKNCYHRLYGTMLEQDLVNETSGNFKRFLRSLCNAGRDESGRIDPNMARIDAQELLSAGVSRIGTDESTFNRVLCQRNFEQLQLVCDEYQKLAGHSLEKAIKKEFSGDIEDGLLAVLRCVKDKAEFFAKRLHSSMAGLGTDDRQLIRLVVARCEIDMADIKVAFERKYGKSLKSFVKGDCSGDYKHAILTLIGEKY